MSLALTIIVLIFACLLLRELLTYFRAAPPSDAVMFWTCVLAGPLVASLLMALIQGVVLVLSALLGITIGLTAVPCVGLMVEFTREWLKKKATA